MTLASRMAASACCRTALMSCSSVGCSGVPPPPAASAARSCPLMVEPRVWPAGNFRPDCGAWAYCRSRVTPGTSSTMASLCPTILLNKVDLPTLGRPTSATRGSTLEPDLLSVHHREAAAHGRLEGGRPVEDRRLHAPQRHQRRALHAHANEIAGRGGSLEVHGPVLARAAEAAVLDQHLHLAADALAVALQRARLLERLYFLEALEGERPRHFSPFIQLEDGAGVRARAVDEGEEVVVRRAREEGEVLRVLLPGLTGKAADAVAGQRKVARHLANPPPVPAHRV